MKPLVLMHLASIQVRWPNGKTEFYDAPAAVDRIIELEERKGHNSPTVSQLSPSAAVIP
jgi:hypothetical protein